MSSVETFVFGEVEVRPTGRTATKVIKLSSRTHTDVLIEIEPIDKTGPTWKKWVRETELYKVE